MALRIALLEKTATAARFELLDAELAVVNALRRAVMSDVVNVAVDVASVRFATNTGTLHNEMLAHRLSLLPVCVSPGEVAAAADYVLELSADNPSGGGDVPVRHVWSTDVVVKERATGRRRDDLARRWFPRDGFTGDAMLLTSLKPGEAVAAEMSLAAGTPRTHGAAFGCTSVATFTYKVDAAMAAAARPSDPEEAADFDRLDALRCFRVDPETGEPTAFVFAIESTCAFTPEDIVEAALDALASKVRGMAPEVALGDAGVHTLLLRGEGHTLGNLFQATCFRELHGRGVSFVGYHVPHPLEDAVKVLVACGSADDVADVVERTRVAMMARVDAVRAAWRAATRKGP